MGFVHSSEVDDMLYSRRYHCPGSYLTPPISRDLQILVLHPQMSFYWVDTLLPSLPYCLLMVRPQSPVSRYFYISFIIVWQIHRHTHTHALMHTCKHEISSVFNTPITLSHPSSLLMKSFLSASLFLIWWIFFDTLSFLIDVYMSMRMLSSGILETYKWVWQWRK